MVVGSKRNADPRVKLGGGMGGGGGHFHETSFEALHVPRPRALLGPNVATSSDNFITQKSEMDRSEGNIRKTTLT